MQPAHGRFMHFCEKLEDVQAEKLSRYLNTNSNTTYGATFDFAGIKGHSAYASNVPIIEEFEQFRPYIDKIAAGEKNVLTKEEILFFETTSGSSGKAKWIPYTSKLKGEFQEGLGVWMHELYKKNPAIFSGHQYWSISPAVKDREVTSGGLRIGIQNDLEYLGRLEAWMMGKVMAIPPSISQISEADEFFFHLSVALLANENLSFISIWSPTYMLKIHSFIREHLSEILSQLQCGNSRKIMIKRGFEEGKWSVVFPNLQLVSCWTDAQAALWQNDLKALLGNVNIEGKGLLSTEGIVTVPMASGMKALSYHSHFYEFRHQPGGEVFLAHQLERGKTYEVILTTGGGLYRYASSDLVTVSGYLGKVPCFVFEGRKNQTSDLVGEKLTSKHVMEMIQILKDKTGVKVMGLVPVRSENGLAYKLLVVVETECIPSLQQMAEAILSANPYYAQAIKLGQLQNLQLFHLGEGGDLRLFQYYCQKMGLKEGDAKLPLIFPVNFLDDY